VSSISKGLGDDVNKLARNIALSAPVVPFPWSKSGVGLGALWVGTNSGIINTATQQFRNKINNQRIGLFDNNTPPKNNNTWSWTKIAPAPLAANLGTAVTTSITTNGGTVSADNIQNTLNNPWTTRGITADQIQEIESTINVSESKSVSLTHNDNNQSTTYTISKENDSFVVKEQNASTNNNTTSNTSSNIADNT
jgi:hypothetical protein